MNAPLKTDSTGKDIFERLKPLIERVHQSLVNSIHPELPVHLREPILFFLETPGKMVRPLLTLLSAQVVGGSMEAALPAATAVELFHDFTLIHDDIMDRDELRRGRPTIHVKWDDGTAILVGDALIGLAYQQLMKSPAKHLVAVINLFSESIVKVCEGQALDKEFETREEVSLVEYEEMISKKTAWLIKVSCALGALVGGGTDSQIDALSSFGHYLGMGFQIQDDLLDVIADEAKLGKRLGSDFRMDKKTYVTLKFREMMRKHPEIRKQYPATAVEFSSFQEFQQALYKMGLVDEVLQDVNAYIQSSLEALARVMPLDNNNSLLLMTRFLQHRQY